MKKYFGYLNILYYLYLLFFSILSFFIFKKYNFSFDNIKDVHFNFFLISIFFCILLIFFINNKTFKKFFTIYFSLFVLTAYCYEVYVYKFIFDYKFSNLDKLRYETAKKRNIDFNTKNKFDKFLDFKKENENASLIFSVASYYRKNILSNMFPLSGISNTKTLGCNENGYFSYYYSDRYGFNNPDKEWDKATDIILVGDSFAQGLCVKENSNVSSLIRNSSNYSILNLGWLGNGPLLEYASLIEYGFNRNPKKIIWIYFEADLINLKSHIEFDLLKNYLIKNTNQDLINKDEEKNKKLKKIIKFQEDKKISNHNSYDYILKIIRLNNFRYVISQLLPKKFRISNFNEDMIHNTKVEHDILAIFENIIKKVKIESDKNNIELYFVYLPKYQSIQSKISNGWNRNEVISIIKSNNINFIDMYDILLKQENFKLFYPFGLDGHFNEEGYKLLSSEILKAIN